MFVKTPFSTSWQPRWFDATKEGNARFQDDEFGDEAEAMAVVKQLLAQGVTEQVDVVKWYHTQNMPGCLPEIRSNSCALTCYTLGADGEPQPKPVDIFERSY